MRKLIKEEERTAMMQKNIEMNKAVMLARDAKVAEIKNAVQELGHELEVLKREARAASPESQRSPSPETRPKEASLDKEQLKQLLKQVQCEYEAELKWQLREKMNLEAKVLSSKSRLGEASLVRIVC